MLIKEKICPLLEGGHKVVRKIDKMVHWEDKDIKTNQSVQVCVKAVSGSFSRENETAYFQIRCEMQRGTDFLRPSNTEGRNKSHSSGVLRRSATKENGVTVHSGGFLQTPKHSTLQCANIRPFLLPLLPCQSSLGSVTRCKLQQSTLLFFFMVLCEYKRLYTCHQP